MENTTVMIIISINYLIYIALLLKRKKKKNKINKYLYFNKR